MTLPLTCKLGSIQFHGWNPARLTSLQNVGEDFSRIGQTGSGSQVLGKRGKPDSVTAWRLCATSAQAQQIAKDCEALQWTVVEAQDGFGNGYPRVRVAASSATVRIGRGTDSARALVTCQFMLEVLP